MKRFAAAAVVVLTVAAVLNGVAFGHSRPIRFDPAPGAVLASAPAQVTGWFTQPLRRDENWTFLRVTNEQGARVDTGALVLSGDRKQMTVNLNANLPAGRYTVSWRGWDDNDGAIYGDCYAFFIGQASADAAVGTNTRLDGGGACQRIDVSARDGTPVAGGTPQATVAAGDGHNDEMGAPMDSSAGESDDGGVPLWSLVAGVIGGLVVGGVGGRLLGGRA